MTQKEHILAALKRKPITPLEALNRFGCFRLAARISELRQEGYQIHTQIRKGFAEYRLVK